MAAGGYPLQAAFAITQGMARGEPTKTIADARRAGETRFTVHCGRIECGHRAELSFDEIRLSGETIFVDIPRLLNFVCTKCGSRDVKVMPIFPPARGCRSAPPSILSGACERAWGRREAMKRVRACLGRDELDLKTLVWTRGAAFPISQLDSRLKCPLCGSRRVALTFDLPKEPNVNRIAGLGL